MNGTALVQGDAQVWRATGGVDNGCLIEIDGKIQVLTRNISPVRWNLDRVNSWGNCLYQNT